MTTTQYKGFDIRARPYLVHESNSWTADLEIRLGGRRQSFALQERYPSEGEAQVACARVGRRIIDHGVKGWSVDHLQELPPNRRTFADVWRQESSFVFICAVLLVVVLSIFVLFRMTGQ